MRTLLSCQIECDMATPLRCFAGRKHTITITITQEKQKQHEVRGNKKTLAAVGQSAIGFLLEGSTCIKFQMINIDKLWIPQTTYSSCYFLKGTISSAKIGQRCSAFIPCPTLIIDKRVRRQHGRTWKDHHIFISIALCLCRRLDWRAVMPFQNKGLPFYVFFHCSIVVRYKKEYIESLHPIMNLNCECKYILLSHVSMFLTSIHLSIHHFVCLGACCGTCLKALHSQTYQNQQLHAPSLLSRGPLFQHLPSWMLGKVMFCKTTLHKHPCKSYWGRDASVRFSPLATALAINLQRRL